MKKIIFIIIVLVVLIAVHGEGYMSSGDLNKDYGGHYVQNVEKGKCIAYHFHKGKWKGWQIDFTIPCEWDDRRDEYDILVKSNKFNPCNANTAGKWSKWETQGDGKNVKFITKLNVPTPTIEPTETSTTIEPTETSTTIEPTETPITIEPTETSTTIEPTETPITIEPTETSITVTPVTEDNIITPSPGTTTPETGESPKLPYVVIGLVLIVGTVIYKVKTM